MIDLFQTSGRGDIAHRRGICGRSQISGRGADLTMMS